MISDLKTLPNYGFEKLMGYMVAAEDENASDGAWWTMLEDAAGFFADDEGIEIDTTDAVQEYLKWKANRPQITEEIE